MPQLVIRRAIPYAAAAVCWAALALPALAAAASGGAGVSSASSGGPPAPSPSTQRGNVTVSASGDGMTISTTAAAILRHGLAVSGTLPSADAGRTLELEVSGLKTHWTWQPVATAQAQSNGTFVVVWQTNHIGRFSIRVVTGSSGAASASASAPTLSVIVYRPSLATLYGPGFYGRRTACGVVLRRSTIGLANRTLPCGTPVAI